MFKDKLKDYDKDNLIETTYRLPDDAEKAFNKVLSQEIPSKYKEFDNILISGMGGSCISADILNSYLYFKSNKPIIINRSSVLPSFVNEKTLSIFISYSGNTIETLNCTKEAINKNSKVACITLGGKLSKVCIENQAYLIKLNDNNKMPRSAIGELFYSLLGFIYKLEVFNINKDEIDSSIIALKKLRDEIDIYKNNINWLVELAMKIINRKIVIFGVNPYTSSVALRWKTQFNENSKLTVIYNNFPELTHNEIVNLFYENLNDYYFIILRDTDEEPFVNKQIETFIELIKDKSMIYNFFTKI
ncbi:MAG: bifunctional phosphoglucose/phosphomannose isomerase [Candidatus Sericytochromatia bacterium]|nr:MAG: bifunctional phosphoglucose/phosphomannose isomerase [Candidatus Sericytochromatia bacterium]